MPRSNPPLPFPRWREGIRFFRLASSGGRALWFLASLAGFGFIVVLVFLFSLPVVTEWSPTPPLHGARLYDRNGRLITELNQERRIFVPRERIPMVLQNAVLAVEDARFYSHFGIDLQGIARAAYDDLRSGRIVEGGSTITQQLARVLFLTPDRSLDRKLKEVILALELEHRYSKHKILEMYLNLVYFGRGAYGVEAAAQAYFGKSVTALSLPEAALLAGLPRAPALYSPFDHPDRARRRRNHVLRRMVAVGILSPKAARRAMKAPLGVLPEEQRTPPGQYFVEYVRNLLVAKYGEDAVFRSGLQVYTTLSSRMERLAELSLRKGLRRWKRRRVSSRVRRRKEVFPEPQGALVTIDPRTGYIEAMVGGRDFSRSEFNRAVQARRQPGSAFKPFVYLAALQEGFTPASRVQDAPVNYPAGKRGERWQPVNYDSRFRGPITLQEGLEDSVNVATVRLQQEIGVKRTIEVARELGIESPLHRDLTLALGSSDLSLLELTGAYAALANRGAWIPPTAIRYVTDARGRILEGHPPRATQEVSPELAYVLTHMLMGVVQRGTAEAARILGRPIAGKTGTTNNYSNAWFVGYTPNLVTGVWVGYDRPRSLGRGETGARAALPIWVDYMGKVLANTPPEGFSVPDGVVLVPVDMDPWGRCTRPVTMAFLKGTQPVPNCGGGLIAVLRRLFHF